MAGKGWAGWEDPLAVVSLLARSPGTTSTYQAEPLPHETPEGVLLARIRKLATRTGWKIYHTHDSRRSEAGFPDIVLTNGTDLLIYELKDNYGKPTADQATWLHLLTHTRKVECGIWRPRDWATIEARLMRTTSA